MILNDRPTHRLTSVFNGRRLGFARNATADTPIGYTDGR
jgi:hypothetical protein